MSVAMIWGSPGSGKTVAATAPKNEKIKLLCSDNSAVVLNMFDRKNVDVERVEHWLDQGDGNYFTAQFERAAASGKYTLIVIDNLTDLKELALMEIEDAGKLKDIRQIYQAVYMAIKRLTRTAANSKCHVTFTCWDDAEEITKNDGTLALRQFPNLPRKILPQVLGLCNIVGQMAKAKDKDGNMRWFLITEDSETRYGCKDQLYGRKSILPEQLYEVAKK
nr:MAG TPA: AAA domain protein [Caudoviricetes sp.]